MDTFFLQFLKTCDQWRELENIDRMHMTLCGLTLPSVLQPQSVMSRPVIRIWQLKKLWTERFQRQEEVSAPIAPRRSVSPLCFTSFDLHQAKRGWKTAFMLCEVCLVTETEIQCSHEFSDGESSTGERLHLASHLLLLFSLIIIYASSSFSSSWFLFYYSISQGSRISDRLQLYYSAIIFRRAVVRTLGMAK